MILVPTCMQKLGTLIATNTYCIANTLITISIYCYPPDYNDPTYWQILPTK